MRVLIISQYFPPDMGGGATRSYNIALGLTRIGCNVTVIAAVPHYPSGNIPQKYRWKPLTVEYSNGIRIIRTFVPPIQSSGVFRRILLFLSFIFSSLFALPLTRDVDVVWAANPNITATFSGFVFKMLKKCYLVQNIDDLWPEALYELGTKRKSILGRFGETMAQFAYKLADAITPISPGYVQVIQKKYKVNPDSIIVVPGGVDITKQAAINHRNPSMVKTKVLYIGAFSPAYDFQQILLAAQKLRDQSNIEFILQGGGELEPVLSRVSKEMNLENLTIVNKIVSRNEVEKILQDADILLLPLAGHKMIELGISSKLYEYQSAGKPIICCSKGESAKYIQHTKSGIIIEPGDFHEIAKSILLLSNDKQLAAELGQNGRNYVNQHLSIENVARQMMKVFSMVGTIK